VDDEIVLDSDELGLAPRANCEPAVRNGPRAYRR
jgi:hypothetical protein